MWTTRKAVELGDHQWRTLIGQHHAVVREHLKRFRGREIDTAGDGFLAAFDGPARAVRAAAAITSDVAKLGVTVRAGIHTGECEIMGEKLSGVAVHIGARVAALAGAGEVLVSNTVKDLVAGSGLLFEDRGGHTVRNVERTTRWVRQQNGGKVRGEAEGLDGAPIGSIEGLVNGEVFSWRLTGSFLSIPGGGAPSKSYSGETTITIDEISGRADGPNCPRTVLLRRVGVDARGNKAR